MAFYDSGVTYDSGLLYDEAASQPVKKHMAKIKSNIRGLSDLQTIQQCNTIKTALTGNANFTTPTPTLASLATLITTAQTKVTAAESAQNAAKQATTDKDTAMDALRAAAGQLASYVDLTANGDESKILSSGFSVRATAAPASVPGPVMNVFITAGDSAGELDIQWDPNFDANRYEIQVCADSAFGAGVTSLASTTKSKTVANGLASGTRMWTRVRGLNAAGVGAWSDPATKIVP